MVVNGVKHLGRAPKIVHSAYNPRPTIKDCMGYYDKVLGMWVYKWYVK